MKIEVEMKDVVEGGSVIVVNVVAVVVVAVVVAMVELEGVLNAMKRAILLMHVLIQVIKIIINKNALNVVKLGINHLNVENPVEILEKEEVEDVEGVVDIVVIEVVVVGLINQEVEVEIEIMEVLVLVEGMVLHGVRKLLGVLINNRVMVKVEENNRKPRLCRHHRLRMKDGEHHKLREILDGEKSKKELFFFKKEKIN